MGAEASQKPRGKAGDWRPVKCFGAADSETCRPTAVLRYTDPTIMRDGNSSKTWVKKDWKIGWTRTDVP